MKKDAVTLHCGDCLDVLASLRPNSIDACVTDPPYHLTSVVATHRSAFPGRYAGTPGGAKAGFMGKQWDGGDIAFRPEMWREVYRVLKPGGHILAFGGTRTYHRMACAIEDAGFEIRDCVQWVYGSGFPKSHDVSKGIDKAAETFDVCAPATSAARQWEGWGTALKPANEPICLARNAESPPF